MFQVVPPQRSSASASKGTVLVVDDELTVVRVYARALGAEGFRVLTATDGETAEVMFRRCRLDAVISDVSMPGIDGLTLLHALHAIDPDVPVILATGEQGGELAQRAVEEGALAFLVKPIDLRALAQITAHAIQLRRAAARADGARTEAPRAGAGFEAWLEGLWIAYQPIVGWASLAVLGYEAFVRSDDPSAAEPCDSVRRRRGAGPRAGAGARHPRAHRRRHRGRPGGGPRLRQPARCRAGRRGALRRARAPPRPRRAGGAGGDRARRALLRPRI